MLVILTDLVSLIDRLKWKSLPNSGFPQGYPLIDETGVTAKDGTGLRYNIFSEGNAIYWTPQHGAFVIYGDIYQEWLSIGNVQSVVGYPLTDETSSGTHGGRFNDFSNGMIYWNGGRSYVHVGALPSSISMTWNPINLDDVTGSNTVTISSNGDAHWVSNIHDDVPFPFNWEVSWVLVDADGTSLGLSQSGTVGPNWSPFGSTNDANTDVTTSNSEISQNWRAWVAATWWRAQANNSWDIPIAQMFQTLWKDFSTALNFIEQLIIAMGESIDTTDD
jgi:LGFP repeat